MYKMSYSFSVSVSSSVSLRSPLPLVPDLKGSLLLVMALSISLSVSMMVASVSSVQYSCVQDPALLTGSDVEMSPNHGARSR